MTTAVTALAVGDRIIDPVFGEVATVTAPARPGAGRDYVWLGLDGQDSPFHLSERFTRR